MIFCFGGSLKTHTKCVCLESVRVGHIMHHYNGIWGTCRVFRKWGRGAKSPPTLVTGAPYFFTI